MNVIESPSELRSLYGRFKELCRRSDRSPGEAKITRASGRSGTLDRHVLLDEGIWIAFDESRGECYSILLGTDRSGDRCALEINIPREGRSQSFGGMFLQAQDQRVFIGRSAGLAARGEWRRFITQFEMLSAVVDGQLVALVGDLTSDRFFLEVAHFLKRLEDFRIATSHKPQGTAWRDHLLGLLHERGEALGRQVMLPLYWKGDTQDRIDGFLVGDEFRVRVTPEIIAELDRIPESYSAGLKDDTHRRTWNRCVEAMRSNVNKTVSLNQYGSGYCTPTKTPDRLTTQFNVYAVFEVSPEDEEVRDLLTDEERRVLRQSLDGNGRSTLPMNQFGHILFRLASGDDGSPVEEQKHVPAMVDGEDEDDEEGSDERAWTRHRNVIFFGPPGTGKSHQVQDIVGTHLVAKPEQVKRVTFHPEYSYFDFVGSYRPAVGWLKTTAQFTDADGVQHDREPRTYYRFEPGPFSHALAMAARQKEEPVVLIVEEINRGNCAAIFGDVFQLLDRVNDARRPEREGWSEYAVVPSAEWAAWLEAQVPKGSEVFDPKTRQLRLPGNLYLYATMNTSDQSLFPMDTAFRRRWAMSYCGVDSHAQPTARVQLHAGDATGVQWIALMRALNKEIVDHTRTDDKQMGPWFTRPRAGESLIDRQEFKSKILHYLWNSVFRDRPARVFHQDVDTYEALLARYDKGHHVFQTSVLVALGVSDGATPGPTPVTQA